MLVRRRTSLVLFTAVLVAGCSAHWQYTAAGCRDWMRVRVHSQDQVQCDALLARIHSEERADVHR